MKVKTHARNEHHIHGETDLHELVSSQGFTPQTVVNNEFRIRVVSEERQGKPHIRLRKFTAELNKRTEQLTITRDE